MAHYFDWPTLLSTYLSNELFWGLFQVIYSWEQFFEHSLERWNSFEHFFEHSQECTYSQEHFFEWIYSHECSFGHFLKGSRSTRTYLKIRVHSSFCLEMTPARDFEDVWTETSGICQAVSQEATSCHADYDHRKRIFPYFCSIYGGDWMNWPK